MLCAGVSLLVGCTIKAPANFLFDRNTDVTAEKNGTADGLCRAPFYQHHFNDGTTYDRSEGF